ncbi:MAG: hypothetical protein CVV05_00045 [Gammaproteobacteria bacterium HGW-Gammaproteobacteria-1]|nr:MAG: hypothetical protein CVV05_00045 [Gammaproteobacteria bacterium HGW-Gammaproteobacteria-1]
MAFGMRVYWKLFKSGALVGILPVIALAATHLYNREQLYASLAETIADTSTLLGAAKDLRQNGSQDSYKLLLQGHRAGFGVASVMLASHYEQLMRERWSEELCRETGEYCDKAAHSWLSVTPDMMVDVFTDCEKTHSAREREICAAGAGSYLWGATACASQGALMDAMDCGTRATILAGIERRRADLERVAASSPGRLELWWYTAMLLHGQYELPKLPTVR